MAKLTRVTGKVFAGNADEGQIGQFGSAKTGTPNPTSDVAEIQALTAYSKGWDDAVVSNRNYPPLEEVNGVLKTISYQACYLLQEGIPTYDSGTNYSATSIVKTFNEYGLQFFLSKHDENIGNPLSSTSDWEVVYFQTGYEDNITANRSISLTGAVSGSVSYQLTDSGKYALTIPTTGQSKTISLTGAVTGSATLNTGNSSSVSISTTLTPKTFTANAQTLSAKVQTSLSSILPNDGNTYFIWVYNSLYSTSNTPSGANVQTDIFPETRFNYTDGDDGRESCSVGLVCVPVGTDRWVKVSSKSTLIGYMKA